MQNDMPMARHSTDWGCDKVIAAEEVDLFCHQFTREGTL